MLPSLPSDRFLALTRDFAARHRPERRACPPRQEAAPSKRLTSFARASHAGTFRARCHFLIILSRSQSRIAQILPLFERKLCDPTAPKRSTSIPKRPAPTLVSPWTRRFVFSDAAAKPTPSLRRRRRRRPEDISSDRRPTPTGRRRSCAFCS